MLTLHNRAVAAKKAMLMFLLIYNFMENEG